MLFLEMSGSQDSSSGSQPTDLDQKIKVQKWDHIAELEFLSEQRKLHIDQITSYTGRAIFVIVVTVFSIAFSDSSLLSGLKGKYCEIVIFGLLLLIVIVLFFVALVQISTHNIEKIKDIEYLMREYTKEGGTIEKSKLEGLFKVHKGFN